MGFLTVVLVLLGAKSALAATTASEDRPAAVLLLFQAAASGACAGKCDLEAELRPCGPEERPETTFSVAALPPLNTSALLVDGWNSLSLTRAVADSVEASLSVVCAASSAPTCIPTPARLTAWRGAACQPLVATNHGNEEGDPAATLADLTPLLSGGAEGAAVMSAGDQAFQLVGAGSTPLITVAVQWPLATAQVAEPPPAPTALTVETATEVEASDATAVEGAAAEATPVCLESPAPEQSLAVAQCSSSGWRGQRLALKTGLFVWVLASAALVPRLVR